MTQHKYPREKDLAGYVAHAQTMVDQDAKSIRDGGTCVLGAGIAVMAIPKGCRKPKQIILVQAAFQGEGPSFQAAQRAIHWLKQEGVDAYWYGGIMD